MLHPPRAPHLHAPSSQFLCTTKSQMTAKSQVTNLSVTSHKPACVSTGWPTSADVAVPFPPLFRTLVTCSVWFRFALGSRGPIQAALQEEEVQQYTVTIEDFVSEADAP